MTIEKELSEQDSLDLIRQMIETAKQENRNDGKAWILWGWFLFLASLFSFVNDKIYLFSQYFFWNLFGVLCLSFFIFKLCRYFFFSTREKVKTYTNDLLQRLNIGFFVSLLFNILAMNFTIDPVAGFAILINLYGFWLLIYGTVLNFKPFTIGAFVTWCFGIAGLFVNTFDKIMLIHAAAVLCGYIIPGHLANREYRKAKRAELPNPDYSV
jgi:hypothetical protein